MSDLGSQLPVPVNQTRETKEMKLKWLQSAKQERISRIVHLKQNIEDLLKGKIPEIERQMLCAEQELQNLCKAEEVEKRSIEGEEIK
jgi:transcriptional regulatory protein LevR